MARNTVRLEDELLSAAIREEAARRRTTPAELLRQAVREWLESQEDAEIRPVLDAARREWKEQGGQEAAEFFRQVRQGGPDSR